MFVAGLLVLSRTFENSRTSYEVVLVLTKLSVVLEQVKVVFFQHSCTSYFSRFLLFRTRTKKVVLLLVFSP